MTGLLLALAYASLFLYAIRKVPFFSAPGLPRRWIGAFLLLKIVAGTALWYVYTYVHTDRATADIYRFFDDGNIMFRALPEHPLDYLRMITGIGNDQKRFDLNYYQVMNNWYRQYEGNLYNDAHTMIRFNAFVRLFSFGHYHVHTVFICFFCTIGLVALYRAFAPLLPGHERAWSLTLFVLPSVLFWTSGVLKEALLIFGLGLFLLAVLELLRGRKRTWLLVLPPTIALLFFLKFYVLLSLVPALGAYAWCARTGARQPLLKSGIAFTTFLVLGLNSDLFYPNFRMLEVLYVKQRDFIGMATAAHSDSFVDVTPLEPNLRSFISQAPHALYMTFLSPLTAWRTGVLGTLSAVENLWLLILPLLAFRWRRPQAQVDKPLLFFCLGFCILLALVIGWTTPVIGAIVRYRVPLLPFLIMACLCIADPARVPWPSWMRIPSDQ